jgi:hypothetical protein
MCGVGFLFLPRTRTSSVGKEKLWSQPSEPGWRQQVPQATGMGAEHRKKRRNLFLKPSHMGCDSVVGHLLSLCVLSMAKNTYR